MSSIKTAYGSNGQAVTVTLASLTTGSARASTAIDNTSNLFVDALFQLVIKSAGSSTSSTGYVNVYAAGTADGGTTYGNSATGSDAAITLTSPPNVRLIGSLNVVANSTTYKSNPMSVAAAFGGVLPDHWVIIIENQSGGTLDSTEGNHLKVYQGVYASVS
jgi:hypothetical protein